MGTTEQAKHTAESHRSRFGLLGGGRRQQDQAGLESAPGQARERTRGAPLAAGMVAFVLADRGSAAADSRERDLAAKAKEGAAEPVKERVGGTAQDLKANLREPAQEAVEHVKQSAVEATEEVKEEGRSAAEDVRADGGVGRKRPSGPDPRRWFGTSLRRQEGDRH